MFQASCPNCSASVRRDHDYCPSCGMNISFTLGEAETQAGSASTVGGLDFIPGQSFAGRFTIIERIGAGGMGVVYKAIDTALDTVVALKLIQPVLACSRSNVDRFRREVRMTRQVTHPNICRIHDIGKSAGVMYLSMEWIEGETLQQLLGQTGMLKEGRALEIARDIAQALEAAHAAGIVHRDLKPANVMVNRRGDVCVLDFGLALERGTDSLTAQGSQVGTPLYMAPEQRAGQPLDERTDLYALGLILREMLTGNRTTAEAIRLDELSEKVNPLIAPVLQRLLAPEREDRFASAAVVRRELLDLLENPAISLSAPSLPGHSGGPALERRRRRLRRVSASLAIVIVAVVVVAYALRRQAGPPSMGAGAQVFYDRGLHYLREESEYVRSLDDAIHMFHRALDVEPRSALLMATLAEAYWMRFERTLEPRSREEAERVLSEAELLDPDLPEVRYARALGFIVEGKYQAARPKLEQVVAAKSDFAMAWVNLGVVYQHLGDYAKARSAFERAMQLEPSSFRVQLYAGNFHEAFQEYEAALDYYRKATELKPNSGIAWNNLGAALLYTSRFDEAIPAIRRSIEIEDNAHARTNLGTSYYFRGEFETAVENYQRATELQPREPVHFGNLGDGLLALDRIEQAQEAYRTAADLARERVLAEPLHADVLMDLAVYCAKAADDACARQNGARAVELRPASGDLLLRQATVLCILGQDDEALDLLDRAVRLGASRAQIEATPELSKFADHPRYTEILALAG